MFFKTSSESIRSRVTLDEIDGLQIAIPAAGKRSLRFFLIAWLIGWAIGELTVLGSIAAMGLGVPIGAKFGNVGGMELPFLSLWLAGWTVAGIAVIDILAWQFRGRETIRIDPDGEGLVIRRLGTFFPRPTRSFPLREVRNLRFAPLVPTISVLPTREALEAQLQWFGNVGGNIAFDCDGRTWRFGSQLSETESRRLIKTIKDHFKIEDDRDEPLPIERS